MAEVEFRIFEDPEALSRARAEALLALLRREPDAVLLLNTGNTPARTYDLLAAAGADLSRARIRLLDGFLLSPSRGFSSLEHPACFTAFARRRLVEAFPEEHRPRDWVLPPEDAASCEEIAEALENSPGDWDRPAHPKTGEPGSEIRIAAQAGGVLGRIRRICLAYDALLEQDPPRIASAGVGPLPYPHLAFNNAPYTRPDAGTHLTMIDGTVAEAHASAFGGRARVPPFALTVGPATVAGAAEVWITAFGEEKAAAVAEALGRPAEPDFELRSSLAYAFRAPKVSIHLDEDAASDLLDETGSAGLTAAYERAGHRAVVRRV